MYISSPASPSRTTVEPAAICVGCRAIAIAASSAGSPPAKSGTRDPHLGAEETRASHDVFRGHLAAVLENAQFRGPGAALELADEEPPGMRENL